MATAGYSGVIAKFNDRLQSPFGVTRKAFRTSRPRSNFFIKHARCEHRTRRTSTSLLRAWKPMHAYGYRNLWRKPIRSMRGFQRSTQYRNRDLAVRKYKRSVRLTRYSSDPLRDLRHGASTHLALNFN